MTAGGAPSAPTLACAAAADRKQAALAISAPSLVDAFEARRHEAEASPNLSEADDGMVGGSIYPEETHSTTAGWSSKPTDASPLEEEISVSAPPEDGARFQAPPTADPLPHISVSPPDDGGGNPKEAQFYARLTSLVAQLAEAHEEDLARLQDALSSPCSSLSSPGRTRRTSHGRPRDDHVEVVELRAANGVLRAELLSMQQERQRVGGASSARPSVLGRMSKSSERGHGPPMTTMSSSGSHRVPVRAGCAMPAVERDANRQPSSLSRDTKFEVKPTWRPNPSQTHTARKFSLSRSRSFAILAQGQTQAEEIVVGEGRLQPYVLHPGSSKRLAWDLMSMALLAYDILVIPFSSAFNPRANLFTELMMYFTLLFWTCDVGASLLTGYTHGRETVLKPSHIAINYLKTWFLLDMIIIGMDWTLVFLSGPGNGDGGQSAARLGRSLRTLRFVRTLRLIRVLKMKRIVQEIQDHINTEAVSICFGITKIVLCLILANHILACVWYAIGLIGSDEQKETWVTMNAMTGRSMAYRYATSLHWSLTQFTPASMEIVPENINERVFSVIVLVFAMITFSSFVSILTASIAQLRNIRNDETRQFWLLRRYLRDCGASRRTGLRVQRYLEYAYHQQCQRVQEKEVGLLGLLSEPLREELKHETLSQHLSEHPLFPTCDDRTRVFSKALAAMSLARGDLVFTCGEHASRMIFLCTGGMEYSAEELSANDGCPSGDSSPQSPSAATALSPSAAASALAESEVLVPGQWVCEAVLWTPWIHLGDLFAMMECQVVVIDADNFSRLVQVNTPLLMEMRKYARSFIQALNMLDREDFTDLLHLQFSVQEILDSCEFSRALNQDCDEELNEGFNPLRKMKQRLRRSVRKTARGWNHYSNLLFRRTQQVDSELSCISPHTASASQAWSSSKLR